MIGVKFLKILEGVHKKFIIHRDLKPENFLVQGEKDMMLIDFGLSKRYVDHRGRHIPRTENKPFRGTLRYCSINMHLGVENSRRDDLESLGYVIIYFCKGKLPWQGIPGRGEQRAQAICKKKRETPISELCKGIPKEVQEYMRICRNLGFDEEPDYRQLSNLLNSALVTSGYE